MWPCPLDKADRCTNCTLYGWKCDMSKPKRCAACKLVSYCSRICQLEHWNKVHKKHCKYLAGTKVRDKVGHLPNLCPKCKIVQGLNKQEVLLELSNRNLNSEVFPCMFVTEVGSLNKIPSSQQPVLGEISGKFSCQSEHCLSIIIHCCLKLAFTHPQDMPWSPSNPMVPIFKKLITFRNMIFYSAIVSPNEDIQEKSALRTTSYFLDTLIEITELCKEHFSEEGDKQVKWWRSVLVFIEVLCKRYYWGRFKYQQEDDFKASIDPVLKAASHQMPPYAELLQAMVGGPRATCEGCRSDIVVDGLEVKREVFDRYFGSERGWVFLSHKGFQSACNKCIGPMRMEEEDLFKALLTKITMSPLYCHQCGRSCRGRPRCKYCQSKAYCSEECQSEDWQVHQLFCKEIQEAEAGGEGGRRVSKREVEKKADERATRIENSFKV